MFDAFDRLFDFDHDGEVDSFERAAEFQFMDRMVKEDNDSGDSDDDFDDFDDDALDDIDL